MQGNMEQRLAITHFQGPCVVAAPPGSGKTFVMIQRILYLLKEQNVPPDRILVITFSKAAAEEMKKRFQEHSAIQGVTFGTFHAVFFHILRNTGQYAVTDLITPAEQKEISLILVQMYLQDREINDEFMESLQEELQKRKNLPQILNNRASLSKDSLSIDPRLWEKLVNSYREEMRRRNKIDYEDMILLCRELLMKRKDILLLWRETYQYLMIDEFQDTSPAQYEIVKLLCNDRNNLFVVGDDDQSIYGFRGASPDIMIHFHEDFPDAVRISLRINYRCSGNICRAAGKVIKRNQKRIEKEMIADRALGAEIAYLEAQDVQKEMELLADVVMEYGVDDFADVAVLVRTHQECSKIAAVLLMKEIPFVMQEKLSSPYSHFIAKDIRAYLKAAQGDRSRSVFFQILNKPMRYLSRESCAESCVDFEKIAGFYQGNRKLLAQISKLERQIMLLHELEPYAAVNFIRRGIGYDGYLKELAVKYEKPYHKYEEAADRLQEEAREFSRIRQWLDHMEQYEQKVIQRKETHDKKGVRIMTMHASKGLEFPVVIIPGLNEKNIPYRKAVTEEMLEEERRLFYVAMTRAMDQLILLAVTENRDNHIQASRFMKELMIMLPRHNKFHRIPSGSEIHQTNRKPN